MFDKTLNNDYGQIIEFKQNAVLNIKKIKSNFEFILKNLPAQQKKCLSELYEELFNIDIIIEEEKSVTDFIYNSYDVISRFLDKNTNSTKHEQLLQYIDIVIMGLDHLTKNYISKLETLIDKTNSNIKGLTTLEKSCSNNDIPYFGPEKLIQLFDDNENIRKEIYEQAKNNNNKKSSSSIKITKQVAQEQKFIKIYLQEQKKELKDIKQTLSKPVNNHGQTNFVMENIHNNNTDFDEKYRNKYVANFISFKEEYTKLTSNNKKDLSSFNKQLYNIINNLTKKFNIILDFSHKEHSTRNIFSDLNPNLIISNEDRNIIKKKNTNVDLLSNDFLSNDDYEKNSKTLTDLVNLKEYLIYKRDEVKCLSSYFEKIKDIQEHFDLIKIEISKNSSKIKHNNIPTNILEITQYKAQEIINNFIKNINTFQTIIKDFSNNDEGNKKLTEQLRLIDATCDQANSLNVFLNKIIEIQNFYYETDQSFNNILDKLNTSKKNFLQITIADNFQKNIKKLNEDLFLKLFKILSSNFDGGSNSNAPYSPFWNNNANSNTANNNNFITLDNAISEFKEEYTGYMDAVLDLGELKTDSNITKTFQ